MKRVRETQERAGAKMWIRERPPDEEEGFIGSAEDEMVVGTNGQVHGGLGGEFRGNELRTKRQPEFCKKTD